VASESAASAAAHGKTGRFDHRVHAAILGFGIRRRHNARANAQSVQDRRRDYRRRDADTKGMNGRAALDHEPRGFKPDAGVMTRDFMQAPAGWDKVAWRQRMKQASALRFRPA
jgi:hypothetical protein